jgi:hypothetical protein
MVLGMALALVLLVEAGYRTQAAVRRAAFGTGGAIEFEEHPTVIHELLREEERSITLEWHPYVYWRRRAFRGRLVNVDSAGRRVTVGSGSSGSGPQILFFGGSTMWGSFQGDAGTIPSTVARWLRHAGAPPVELVNVGETGFGMTQEVIQLLLMLRQGYRPALVVFYDGINDVAAAAQHGQAGIPLNETNRVREFDLGRRVFSWRSDVRAEFRAFTALASVAVARSELLERIRALRPHLPGRVPDAASLADAVVATYVANMEMVEALAMRFGFAPVYLWQPNLLTSRKALTSREQSLRDQALRDPEFARLRQLHREVEARVDSVARAVAGERFRNLSGVFDAVTGPVFTDEVGHTYESANAVLVAEIGPLIRAHLDGRPVLRR